MLPFIRIFSFTIPMYGLCIFLGLCTATYTAYILTKHNKLDFNNFIIIAACTLGMALVSAKLLYIIVTYPIQKFPSILYSILRGKDKGNMYGGFVFYGGLAGGITGFLVGCRIAKCKISDFINIFALITPLAHCFGRIGCFCAGCCYGKVTSCSIHVNYTHPISSVPTGIPIIPIQLYEAAGLFLIFLFILIIFFKKMEFCVPCYITLYSFMRFFLEFYRGDLQRGFLGVLSTSQVISIAGFAADCILFYKKHCRCYSIFIQ